MSGFGIIEDDEFTRQGAALYGTVHALDQMIEAIKWALCHDLTHYPALPGTKGLRVAEVGIGATAAYIFYTEDGMCATLHRIQAA